MHQERKAANEPFLARSMRLATATVIKHPIATIAVAVFLAFGSLVLTGAKLGYKTSRSDLLDPASSYNRLWLGYLDEFGTEEDAVIVVEGQSPEQVVPAILEILQRLSRSPHLFQSVLGEIDLSRLQARGLYFLSKQELTQIDRSLRESRPIVEGQWSRLRADHAITGLVTKWHEQQQASAGTHQSDVPRDLEQYVTSLSTFLEDGQTYVSPFPDIAASVSPLGHAGPEYLLADGGKLGFILLHLAESTDDFLGGSESVSALREIIADVQASNAVQGVTVGLTGIPVLENDEMQASKDSMLSSGVISFVAVGIIVIAGFGGLRHAILANMVLLIGMAWAFAFVTLSVGHLNILSVSFAVTLIGIGIDYGVYYVARYMKARASLIGSGPAACDEALLTTTNCVGPAIAAGAVTTAISFFAAGFTTFPGVAELGIIAGGGILLCALAQLFVLPALIKVVDQSQLGARMPRPLPVHLWIGRMMRVPRLVLVLAVAVTIGLAAGLQNVWYDHNLLNLQAHGQESVELERKLLDGTGQSMWFAISVAETPEQLVERKSQFLKLASVERTEEIVSLFPTDAQAKRPVIQRIAAGLPQQIASAPQISIPSGEELNMALQRAVVELNRFPPLNNLAERASHLSDLVQRLPSPVYAEALSRFQQQSAADLLARLAMLRRVAAVDPPTVGDLPESLASRFVGRNGLHLLKVYGRGNIWDMDSLERFVRDVRSVDANATGNPLQAYEASREMKSSYEQAAFYAMGIILVVLLIDLRSMPYVLLACLPLGVGILQTFGLLGLLGIPLNPANMIALPLILGISVDEGVHIVHDFREQSGRYRIGASTAIAVLVDSLTTVAGFGSLMFASHQGLQSLGRVLTIGITCCTFTSLIMLPALLTWMSRNRDESNVLQQSRPFAREIEPRNELRPPVHEPNDEELMRPRRAYFGERAA